MSFGFGMFLVKLLLTTLTFVFETFDNVDSTTSMSIILIVSIIAISSGQLSCTILTTEHVRCPR